jgi:hypothetical protein
MAGLASGVSGKGKPKTGGTADEGARTEGSKEERGGLKVFTACGGEPVEREFRAGGPEAKRRAAGGGGDTRVMGSYRDRMGVF